MSGTITECAQCKGKTKTTGARCKRTTCKIADYCYQHLASELNLQVKKSAIPGAGMGLFTLIDRKKGENIIEYAGEKRAQAVFDKEPSVYGFSMNKNLVIDARSTQSSVARYANDCRASNKRAKQCKSSNSKFSKDTKHNKINIKATRNIKAGEEVFVSYGKGYWKK